MRSDLRGVVTTTMRRSPKHQQGATLIIALIFMIVLTLLAMSSLQVGTLEEKMAGSARDRALALQAAEAALRDAELDLLNRCAPSQRNAAGLDTCTVRRSVAISGVTGFGNNATAATCGFAAHNRGLCLPADAVAGDPFQRPQLPAEMLNDGASTFVTLGTYTGAAAIAGLAAQPRYLIEGLCFRTQGGSLSGCPEYLYRVTAIGIGQRADTRVMLQSFFRRPAGA